MHPEQNLCKYSLTDLSGRWNFSLVAGCSLRFVHCSLPFACCSLLFARCSLLFARCSLLFACCSLLFARYFLLVVCYFLLVAREESMKDFSLSMSKKRVLHICKKKFNKLKIRIVFNWRLSAIFTGTKDKIIWKFSI